MATNLTKGILRAEMLAIVTALDEVDIRQVREVLRTRWGDLSVEMDNCVMLFIAGIHGDEFGKLGPKERSTKWMKMQVR